jgi:hypothetical protein
LEVYVSLKGSLETFALSEVLQLLADTSKTGELYLQGEDGVEGRVWIRDGAIAAFDVEGSYEPDDAIFQMLGATRGAFSFDAEGAAPESARTPAWDRHDVRAELSRAQTKMAEWVDILAVVPSLEHRVQLRAEAPADNVSIDRAQWEMLVAIGGGGAVHQVLADRNLGKFDGCKAVKGLIDAELVDIAEAVQPEPIEEIPDEEVMAAETDLPLVDEVHDVEETEVPEAVGAGTEEPDYFPKPVTASAETEDPYASLREAIAEAAEAEELAESDGASPTPDDEPVPLEGASAPADSPETAEAHAAEDLPPEAATEESDGHSALRALLAEVTAQVGDTPENDEDHEPVDGLEDRGPWTSNELASLDPVAGDGEVIEATGEAEPVQESGEPEAAEEEAPAEEPINRGLLLKFLSSVRN